MGERVEEGKEDKYFSFQQEIFKLKFLVLKNQVVLSIGSQYHLRKPGSIFLLWAK